MEIEVLAGAREAVEALDLGLQSRAIDAALCRQLLDRAGLLHEPARFPFGRRHARRLGAPGIALAVPAIHDDIGRHVIRVERLAIGHVGLAFVHDALAVSVHDDHVRLREVGVVHVGGAALRRDRPRHPPGLVHQIERRTVAFGNLDHLAGVAGIGVGPFG